MTPEDRAFLLDELRNSRDALFAAVDGMPEDEAARATAGGWSALSFVEHCVLAEESMIAAIESGGEPVEPSDRSRIEASIMRHGATRTRKVEAPAAMVPHGRYAALADAVAAFAAVRDRTIAFVEQSPGDLRNRMVLHPIGQITSRECLLLIIQHPLRHARQILEQRAPSL